MEDIYINSKRGKKKMKKKDGEIVDRDNECCNI